MSNSLCHAITCRKHIAQVILCLVIDIDECVDSDSECIEVTICTSEPESFAQECSSDDWIDCEST